MDLMASILRLASGLAFACLTASTAAQPAVLPRIGWVISGTPENTRHVLQSIHAGLADEGLADGRDVVLDMRYTAGRSELYAPLFKELTRQPVAVLAAASFAGISAARDASAGRTPVSAFFCGNDVKLMVESFAHPGGNITGVSCLSEELAVKRVELLKLALPGIRHIGFLYNGRDPAKEKELADVRRIAAQLGMTVIAAPAASAQALREAISGARRDGAEALVISEDSFTYGNHEAIVALSAEHRMVSIASFREFPQAGGVLSYGANVAERIRMQARYAAKMVRGAKPADLPIDQATRFEFVVNRRVARDLGVVIPQTVLTRADEVID